VSLEVRDVYAGYPGGGEVLHGVSFTVREGGVTALLGANGAGKTTTLRAITGALAHHGEIRFEGRALMHLGVDRIARLGIGHVPQGRGTLTGLTVLDNLMVGAVMRRDRAAVRSDLDFCLDLFPRLDERRQQPAGNLSGGEQQMLALARALMSAPTLLLLDEPSLGLSPKVTVDLYASVARLRQIRPISMLVVEQNAQLALSLADQGVVLESGNVRTTGPAAELLADDAIRRAYLGD
jgi:branched-chain amino acid transport system ATP-binding protein